jgi:hypothetical protein
MAIVDGKRIKGIRFYKTKGKQEYWFTEDHDSLWGAIGELDTRDPRGCFLEDSLVSRVKIPIFVDYVGRIERGTLADLTPVSWRKIPEGWRELFRARLW